MRMDNSLCYRRYTAIGDTTFIWLGTAPRCRRQGPVVAPGSSGGAGVQWWRRGPMVAPGCSGGAEV